MDTATRICYAIRFLQDEGHTAAEIHRTIFIANAENFLQLLVFDRCFYGRKCSVVLSTSRGPVMDPLHSARDFS